MMGAANADKATVDFETRSACDLKACGAWVYSLHPSTQILCMAYRLPHWAAGVTALWHPRFPAIGLDEHLDTPALCELLDWVEAGLPLEAHNAFFERALWANVLTPRHGFPLPGVDQWRCSAAKAAAHALPRQLDKAGAALALTVQKDEAGKKVMMKVSKPRKPRKKEREAWQKLHGDAPHPTLWWEDQALFQRLFDYCRQDVLAEEALSHSLDDLSPQETTYYCLDQRMNQRGFQLDIGAVQTALTLIASEAKLLNSELAELTGGQVTKATQRAKMMAWLATQGLHLDDTRGTTLDEWLLPDSVAALSTPARRAIEILRTLGRSSTAKYCVAPGTRVLKSDLTWVSAMSLRSGDTLLAFDEESSPEQGKGRTFQPSVVEQIQQIECPLVFVKTSRGIIYVSSDHQFLVLSKTGKPRIEWKAASALVPEDSLLFFGAPWETDLSHSGGYLAGFLDGEGSVSQGRVTWAQNAGPVHARVVDLLKMKGFPCATNRKDASGCMHAWFTGGVRGFARVLGALRPHRLLAGAEQTWRGRRLNGKTAVLASVLCIRHLGPGPVLAIQTSTRTLITEGFFSHNCTMRDWACPDGRVRGGLLYHGASTGRWTGAGVQPQNFPKGTLKHFDPEAAWTLLKTGDRSQILAQYPSVMEVLSCALRGAIVAAAGHQLYVADYASIEARVLLWLAGEQDALRLFREGGDLYCDLASSIYDRPITEQDKLERQVGKFAILGLGYQMGWSKFQATCATFGITIEDEFAQQVVEAYRQKYWQVKQLWYDTEAAACEAVTHKGHLVRHDRTAWQRMGRFLYCTLPSGRRLAYPEPELRKRQTPWGAEKWALTYKGVNTYTRQWERQTSYGGLLVENVVQAVSRDLMAAALQRIEESGVYTPVLSIHDEALAEAPIGQGSVAEFEGLLMTVPTWAAGCPISAVGWRGARYRK